MSKLPKPWEQGYRYPGIGIPTLRQSLYFRADEERRLAARQLPSISEYIDSMHLGEIILPQDVLIISLTNLTVKLKLHWPLIDV